MNYGYLYLLSIKPTSNKLNDFIILNFQLVYWDDRSLFLEHEVITIRDGKVRSLLLSRQHAIGQNGDSTEALLANLPGSKLQPSCPEYIEHWLESMRINSAKLKKDS